MKIKDTEELRKKENKDSPTNPGQIYILGRRLTGTYISGKLL